MCSGTDTSTAKSLALGRQRPTKRAALDSLPRFQGGSWKDPGDHRLSRQSTIMGPAGLTAVFGMGTGVTPPVWSPENRPAGCQAAPAAIPRWSVTGTKSSRHTRSSGTSARTKTNPLAFVICHLAFVICHLPSGICHLPSVIRIESVRPPDRPGWRCCAPAESRSGWSSCLAVRTGRLRRSPAVHARPIDLVVFQEPMQHSLRETSSRRGLRA